MKNNVYSLKNLLTLFLLGLTLFSFSENISAQEDPSSGQNKNSNNSADKNLKSLVRVNPSTLAMEMSIPFVSYPGRNGNSLSVGISYTSKLWRMRNHANYFYLTPYEGNRQYVTQLMPEYAERTVAGWTSSLEVPTIEEKFELYDQEGNPFTFGGDIGWIDGLFNNIFTQNNAPGTGTGGSCSQCNYNYGYCDVSCSSCSGYCYDWCQYTGGMGSGCPGGGTTTGGGTGPGTGSPTPTPSGSPTPTPSPSPSPMPTPTPPINPPFETPIEPEDRMYYIKRVNVRMGDGSVHEFRKSDGRYGYCVGGPNDGPDCEAISPDNYGDFLSVDGSGMRLNRTTEGSILYLPNGSRYIFPAAATGQADRAALYRAKSYIDVDGNKTVYDKNQDGIIVTTDTLGRQIGDILPENKNRQTQVEGDQEIYLSGMDGGQQQVYKLKWRHLKPVECTTEVTTNCGNPEGALENQEERLYHYTAITCFGSAYSWVDYNGNNGNQYPDEILFPLNGWGLRSCNPYSGNTLSNLTALRFNPVVLAGVVLPNGQQYEFKYNQYGEITKIVHPTGSVETFTYKAFTPLNGYNESAYDQTNRGVGEHAIYSKEGVLQGIPQQRFKYSAQYNHNFNYLNASYKVTTTASKPTDPNVDGVKTEKFTFVDNRIKRDYDFSDPRAGMPKEEITRDPSGNIRSRTLTEWIVKGAVPTNDPLRPALSGAMRDARVKRTVSIIIENNQALATLSENEYEMPGENGNPAPTDPKYFAHLNVKRSKGYHYAVIPVETAKTGTLTDIAAYFNSSLLASVLETDYQYNEDTEKYVLRGIPSLPIETRVLNPQNTSQILAKTQTVYDEYDFASSGDLPSNLENTWVAPLTDQSIPSDSRELRGKPTTGKLWDSDNGDWIQTHTQYDKYGNGRKVWEANEPVTSDRFAEKQYGSEFGFAYPTKVITPAPDPSGTYGTSQKSEIVTTYDFMTGLTLTITDLGDLTTSSDDRTTTTEYNDSLLRPTKIIPPAGASIIENEYGDTPGNMYIKTKKQITQNSWNESVILIDSLGRVYQTQAKDSQRTVFIDTEYDYMGRVKRTSKPYLQNQVKVWVETVYDEVGRTNELVSPQIANESVPAKIKSEYNLATTGNQIGRVVISTNQAGKKGRSITNALGQLIRFDEPDNSGELGTIDNPTQPTYYKYNVQGKLVEVTQLNQKRFFLYDSLGRLIRIRQPEQDVNASLALTDPTTGNSQWTAALTYDNRGNLLSSTDAKGVAINYSYDKLNRLITRNYTIPQTTDPKKITYTTSNVVFKYDGLLSPLPGGQTQSSGNYSKGQLTEVTNGISTMQKTAFDNQGKVLKSQQIVDGNVYPFEYEYDLAGNLTKEKYPSGRTVTNSFDNSSDLTSVTGQIPNRTPRFYARNFVHNANGDIESFQLGNGRWENYQYNARNQLTQVGLGTSAATSNLWKINYDYGRLDSQGAVDVAKNDGNIVKQTITVPGMPNQFVQAYSYDSINRLTEAKETYGSQEMWKQTFQYDRYGNRTGFSETVGQIPTPLNNVNNPTIDAANNRFTAAQGYEYDYAGNLIQDAENRKFVFDAENKQREVANLSGGVIANYDYDADGRRVRKTVTANQQTTVFIYDAFGKLAAEYSNIPPPEPKIRYLTTDIVNSTRVVTDQFGQVVARHDYKPFGEELYANPATNRSTDFNYGYGDDIRKKFAGYERDDETQLDFAEARYYNGKHGRFTAVDPLLASGKSMNPQTFNRYVYAGNNPTLRTDPNGTDWCVTRNVRRFQSGTRGDGPAEIVYSWANVCSGKNTSRLRNHVVFVNAGIHAGKYVALNPYDKITVGYDTPEQAQRGLQKMKVQAALDFLVGVAEANSVIFELTGAGGYVANQNSTPYNIGRNAGTAGMIISTATSGTVAAVKLVELAGRLGLKFSAKEITQALKGIKLCCFTAGTPIRTDKGLVPIEQIKVGDKVLSYDEKTKRFEYKTVAQTFIAVKENIVKIKIRGEKLLTTTTEHPFYVKKKYRARDALSSDDDEEGEWLTASELKVGQRVLRPDGKWTRITSITYETTPTLVYNFEVEGNHNYFVGEIGVLSHNCGIYKTGDLFETAFETAKGKVGMLADVVVDGKKITLKDIAIYSLDGGDLPSGSVTLEVFRNKEKLFKELAEAGYTHIRLIGERMPNSSSANPGRVFDSGFIDLTRYLD